MAVLEDLGFSTSSLANGRRLPGFDIPYTTFLPELEENDTRVRWMAKPRPNTAADVEQSELGDRHEVAEGEFGSVREAVRATDKKRTPDKGEGDAARLRSELARDLLRRVDAIKSSIGNLSLAAGVQLLKRDLSRAYDVLGDHPSENNFISLVTLLEASMAQLKWKQYTHQQVDALREVLDLAYRSTSISFDDCEHARAWLAKARVNTSPRIDLHSLSMDDLTDGEEE